MAIRTNAYPLTLIAGLCTCSVTQSCPTSCYSLPGTSVHGIFQAEILDGLPIPTPRHLSYPGLKLSSPKIPALVGIFFTTAPPEKHL